MAQSPRLPRTTPEAAGIPSAAIMSFIEALEGHDHPLEAVHSFMLLRHGTVAAEGWWAPYAPDRPHMLYSLSKSFTSTAIGIAVAEGRLSVDDPVLGFFLDDAPVDPSAHLRAMQVRHLLTMTTGHDEDPTWPIFQGEEKNWARAILSLPVVHEPGSWFVYNSAATYLLSAILTKLTGDTLLDYLRPRLFDPLGIANPAWDAGPGGITLGSTGLHATTEDIACFGQLYLQQGEWQGRQLVPAAWVAEATAAHSDNSNTQANVDWSAGYGYQFWRSRHNAYRGDGAFGQFCLVMPDQDAVLAITSGLADMQGVLDTVWAHLLPAMQPDALPTAPAAHDALREKLATLSLPLPEGGAVSPHAARWSGVTYRLEPNDVALDTVALDAGEDQATFTVRNAFGTQAIPVGHGAWLEGIANLRGQGDEPVDASGAWIADDTFEARICLTEHESSYVVRLAFAGDDVRLGIEPNVSWTTTELPVMTGHAHAGAG